MKNGSLFTGYGGLDMAVEAFFDTTTAWTCDIDPGASKIITHRYPDAPNLGDITTINWAAVEPVDGLTAGWPCQPFSLAGKREGAQDERALWPEVTRAVRLLRPRFVVLENVAAIATAGELARAVGDLAALRYDTQWTCLRAADVGAPHGRARIFILATNTNSRADRTEQVSQPRRSRQTITRNAGPHTATDATGNGWDEGWTLATGLLRRPDAAQCSSTGTATDTEGNTWRITHGDDGVTAYPEIPERRGTQPKHLGAPPRSATESRERVGAAATLTDPNSERHGRRQDSGLEGRVDEQPQDQTRQRERPREVIGDRDAATNWGAYEPAIRRWERILGRLAPAPTETSPKGTQRLSPKFVEFMMGLPDGWVTDVPGLNRNSQLKALGNGVVPQQALAALEVMREAA